MYFTNFPKMAYPFEFNGKLEARLVVDITKNVRLIKEVLSNISLFDAYTINDGETIEWISEMVYGTPDYHWTIMLANNRYDYINDFPLPVTIMDNVIIDKYGIDNVNKIHHYEAILNGKTFIVDQTHVSSVPITNSDYEYNMNENKRIIRLISPSIIAQVADQLTKL